MDNERRHGYGEAKIEIRPCHTMFERSPLQLFEKFCKNTNLLHELLGALTAATRRPNLLKTRDQRDPSWIRCGCRLGPQVSRRLDSISCRKSFPTAFLTARLAAWLAVPLRSRWTVSTDVPLSLSRFGCRRGLHGRLPERLKSGLHGLL